MSSKDGKETEELKSKNTRDNMLQRKFGELCEQIPNDPGQTVDIMMELMSKVKIISVNRATLDLFKAKDEKDLIKNYKKLFPRESLANIKQGLISFTKGELSHDTILLAETTNEDMLILDVRWTIVIGGKNKPSNILISMRDITEQKNFEKVLQMQRDFGIALSNIHEIDSLREVTC